MCAVQVMGCDKSYTADGFEMQLGTNHMGHWALIAGDKGLLPHLKAQARTLNQLQAARVLREYVFILVYSTSAVTDPPGVTPSCMLFNWTPRQVTLQKPRMGKLGSKRNAAKSR